MYFFDQTMHIMIIEGTRTPWENTDWNFYVYFADIFITQTMHALSYREPTLPTTKPPPHSPRHRYKKCITSLSTSKLHLPTHQLKLSQNIVPVTCPCGANTLSVLCISATEAIRPHVPLLAGFLSWTDTKNFALSILPVTEWIVLWLRRDKSRTVTYLSWRLR